MSDLNGFRSIYDLFEEQELFPHDPFPSEDNWVEEWREFCHSIGYKHSFVLHLPLYENFSEFFSRGFSNREMKPWTLFWQEESKLLTVFFVDPTDAVYARLVL